MSHPNESLVRQLLGNKPFRPFRLVVGDMEVEVNGPKEVSWHDDGIRVLSGHKGNLTLSMVKYESIECVKLKDWQ